MLKLAWLVPLLVIAGCVPSQSQWQREQEYQKASRAAASSADDKTRAKYTTMANQLEAAANSTKVSGNSLTTNKAVDNYSKDIDVLLDRIATVENDPALQSPRSWLWPYVEPSLKYAREAAASAFITKGTAQLAMKDFDGARNTLRKVVVVFNPNAYGVYTRQAEFLLQDVEKAEVASRNQMSK